MLAVIAAALMLSMAATLPGGTPTASAQEFPEDFTICHRTNAASMPYVVNSPADIGDVQGHAAHIGPIATSPAVAQAIKSAGGLWGDIIPPIPALGFAGLNYDAAGAAIHDAGCEVPTTSATLTIQKECIGTDDGSDFTITVSEDGTLIDTVVLGCAGSDTVSGLVVGVEYTVEETPPDGWTGPNIRGACDGDGTVTIAAGGGTCVVQNVAEEATATLFIQKECIGTDDGTVFPINVSGGIGTVNLECGETSDPITVDADVEYTVSETPPAGWTGPDIRGLCDGDGTFTLDADDEGTCVVTNTAEDTTATLFIQKECAEATDDEFIVSLAGVDDFVLSCGESTDGITIVAGVEYVVSEDEPDGYLEDSIRGACDGDGTVTLDPGEDGICVVRNTPVTPVPPASIVEVETIVDVEVVEAQQGQPPASPVEQVLGVQQVITPPNTGDGGLVETGRSSNGLMIPVLILTGAIGLVTSLSAKRLRHLKR